MCAALYLPDTRQHWFRGLCGNSPRERVNLNIYIYSSGNSSIPLERSAQATSGAMDVSGSHATGGVSSSHGLP